MQSMRTSRRIRFLLLPPPLLVLLCWTFRHSVTFDVLIYDPRPSHYRFLLPGGPRH